MRPTGSLSAVMSKNTLGKLISPVGGFDLVEYEKMEANAPAYEWLGTKQRWNCRRVNKRYVLDAIMKNSIGFRGYVRERRDDATTSKEIGNATKTGVVAWKWMRDYWLRGTSACLCVLRLPSATKPNG